MQTSPGLPLTLRGAAIACAATSSCPISRTSGKSHQLLPSLREFGGITTGWLTKPPTALRCSICISFTEYAWGAVHSTHYPFLQHRDQSIPHRVQRTRACITPVTETSTPESLLRGH